jgi:hypothetical protein
MLGRGRTRTASASGDDVREDLRLARAAAQEMNQSGARVVRSLRRVADDLRRSANGQSSR